MKKISLNNHQIPFVKSCIHHKIQLTPRKYYKSSIIPSAQAENTNYKNSTQSIIKKLQFTSKYDNEIFSMLGPIILSNLSFPLVSSIDTAVIGHLGTAQLSGVGFSVILINFFLNFLKSISTLLSPVIAKEKSKNNKNSLSQVAAKYIIIGALLSSILGLVIFINSEFVIDILKPAATARPYALTYLKTFALFLPFTIISMCCNGIFRGLKDSQTILKTTFLSSFINIILNLLFVFKFNCGVFGVAIATVIACITESFLSFVILFRRGILKMRDFFDVPKFKDLKPILIQSLSLGVSTVISVILLLYPSTMLSRQGSVIHATFELTRQIGMLGYILALSIDLVAQSLCASYIGKKDYKNARNILLRLITVTLVGTTIITILLFIFLKQVANIYTSDVLLLENFIKAAPIILITFPISSISHLLDGALLSSGQINLITKCKTMSALIGLGGMACMQASGTMNLIGLWIFIRIGFGIHMVYTIYRLFYDKKSVYYSSVKLN